MQRLEHLVGGQWVPHSHPRVFRIDGGAKATRIVSGAPGGNPQFFGALIECMAEPYYLLYVLHTPRGEASAGRYQSPLLSLDQVRSFLMQFADFFAADARFDLWAHSKAEGATVVWDRHNQLFAYGPLDRFAAKMQAMDFVSGDPGVPEPHAHQYRAEFDGMAKELLAAFEWSYSPLRPEDEQ